MSEILKDVKYEALFNRWDTSLKSLKIEHYKSARHYEKRHRWFGVPVVIISAVVGSSLFALINENDMIWLNITAGSISLIGVVLSSLQTFLSYSKLSEKHLITSIKYSALYRELQIKQITGIDKESLIPFIESFRKRWDEIDETAPTLRRSIIKKQEDFIDQEKQGLSNYTSNRILDGAIATS